MQTGQQKQAGSKVKQKADKKGICKCALSKYIGEQSDTEVRIWIIG